MMRENHVTILHITDLHYKREKLFNQKQVFKAFFEDLSVQCKEHGYPEIIIFSGDLVHNADDEKIYDSMFDEFIEPLLRVANCGLSKIYFCPGNHDLQRSGVEATTREISELSDTSATREVLNKAFFDGRISEIIQKRQRRYFDYISFFDYHEEIYGNEVIQLFDLDNINVSILSLNTSWSGFAGIDKVKDLRKLHVPEAPIAEAVSRIPNGRYVVCAQHHPGSWMTEESEECLLNILGSKVDLHLFGHVHSPRPELSTDYNGNTFRNQSGALYSWIDDRYMGYSLIKVKPRDKLLHAIWRTYFRRRGAFDEALDISASGGNIYSCEQARLHFQQSINGHKKEVLREWCLTKNLDQTKNAFDQGVVERPTSDLFVPPPLTQSVFVDDRSDTGSTEFVEKPISFDDLVGSDDNFIIEAYPEYGKTTLLQQFCRTACVSKCKGENNASPFIPVFLNFSEFQPGTDRVERAIRSSLPELPGDISIAILLNEGHLIICVDDVDVTNANRMKILRNFVESFKSNRFVLSMPRRREAAYVKPDLGFAVRFTNLTLGQFSRKNLRALVRKWDEPNIEEEHLLERVISELRAINVPQTPINSTLLLDIMSSDPGFSPINRPTLIERFIEQLLQKRSMTETQRRKFDFKNQVHFLGHLSAHMCETNTYLLESDDLSEFARAYLKKFGLPYSSQDILKDIIQARILNVRPSDGMISFRFRAFLEYFTAKHIATNEDFKSWVFDEGRYLSYLNELEYYSGLERSDSNLLSIVSKRHEIVSGVMFGERFREAMNGDELPSIPMNLDESIKYADDLAAQISERPLTETERDELLEAEIPRDSEGRQEVFRPVPKEISDKFILSLFMYSNLVKNSELITDHQKRQHLSAVLRSWSHVFFASFLHIPSLVKNRRLTVNGLNYVVAYPKEYTDNQVAKEIAVNMPKELARLMCVFLGSEKLEVQLRNPELTEVREPKIMDFFRSSLYIDLKLKNWFKVPQKFSDRVASSVYFQEVMLLKSSEIYRLGGFTSKDAEQNLQNHISSAYARLFSTSRSLENDRRQRKKVALKRARLLSIVKDRNLSDD